MFRAHVIFKYIVQSLLPVFQNLLRLLLGKRVQCSSPIRSSVTFLTIAPWRRHPSPISLEGNAAIPSFVCWTAQRQAGQYGTSVEDIRHAAQAS